MSRTISEITQIWDRTLIKIEERIPDRHVFSGFFEGTYIHSINNNQITVVATSLLAKTMLNTKYLDIVQSVL